MPFFPSLAELPDDGLRPSKVYPPMLALALLAVYVVVDCASYLHPLLLPSRSRTSGVNHPAQDTSLDMFQTR